MAEDLKELTRTYVHQVWNRGKLPARKVSSSWSRCTGARFRTPNSSSTT